MTERILGPTGSPKRRRFLFVPLLAIVAFAMFWIAGAQAVHDVGVFELDGNASTTHGSGLPDDWDRVCHQVTGSDCSTSADTTGATGVTFDTDAAGATIYTGGGSKDDQDISSWAWKNGSVPDKDELTHAYAARYTCGAGCTGTPNDKYLFFGADRFDNSGDSQIGFWFLQGNVAPTGSGGGGGSPFGPDKHKTGDVLILSDFTGGGTSVTIRVFSWDPSHVPASDLVNGALLPLAGGTVSDATCGAAAGDDFCAVVNNPVAPAVTTSPWPYTDKSGNTGFAHGELYEGGVNLSKIAGGAFANECFASFQAETRSSASVSAVLKDFVNGAFQPCVATIKTTPSNTLIHSGGVTDSATVTGSGGGTPTGTVIFHVCGPGTAAPNPLDANGKCSTGGALVGPATGVALVADPSDATKANATSPTFTPPSPGHYCFRGDYVPAAGSFYKAVSDFATTECFDFTTSSIVTTPSNTLIHSGAVTDTATVTGAGAGT